MYLQYVGVTRKGEKIAGEFVGTKEELVEYLRKENIIVVSISERKRKLRNGKYRMIDFSSEIEELSYLVNSGMQIDKAIMILLKNLKKYRSVKIWDEILNEIRGGKQLSVAMKDVLNRNGINISDFYISIISVGEEVGNVSGALKDVARHLNFRLRMIKDIISALSYPAFLVIVSVVAIFFVAYFILPRFATIFTPKDLRNIPTISRIFIEFGQFVHSNPMIVFLTFSLLLTLVVMIFSFDKSRRIVFELFQRMPIIRDISMELHISNLCSSLGIMLEGGVSIEKSMKLAHNVVSHPNLKNVVLETYEALKRGIRISDVWSKYSFIPDDVVSLIAVGETSASLSEVFNKLGYKHLENFRLKVSKVMTFLEPAMIMLLGLFVGAIVVSIMLAVLSLTNVS